MAQGVLPAIPVGASSSVKAKDSSEVAQAEVRVEVHDASRLEWSVSIPLPETEKSPFAIELAVEIPSNTFVQHSPWDQLQKYVRLDGPEDVVHDAAPTLDGLRRGAIAVANRLARASQGFARHCRAEASPFVSTDEPNHLDAMKTWLAAGQQSLAAARARLAAAPTDEAVDLRRERDLVDEFLSGRFVELLGSAERTLAASAFAPEDKRPIEETLARLLERETQHRVARKFAYAELRTERDLEGYLDRTSQLKKHFQEVLFLEAEEVAVAQRLHHVLAAVAAILASLWAFVFQIGFASGSTSTRVSSSVVVVALVAGLAYAVKDRIKEVGRTWVQSNVHRFYAQRTATYRAPKKTRSSGEPIVRAKESFVREEAARPDVLNPDCGANTPVTILRYRQRGTVEPQASLAKTGVTRVKHVFRYDLSPLFARLDDATKPVPIFDEEQKRVRFVDAPRCYRIPIELRTDLGGRVAVERLILVLSKRGLDRLESAAA
jgi:hypothetical protein